jgi:lysosomal alpha-mannosidase
MPGRCIDAQAFFIRWWQDAANNTKAMVRRQAATGQLEFTNGGIVQHDEACSHYVDMIDQMTLGMR